MEKSKEKSMKTSTMIQLLIIFALLITSVLIYNYFNYTDAIEFKMSHESLNNVVNAEGENVHSRLIIPRRNNVIILSFDQLIEMLENGTGIIYFGRPGCAWSRKLIPPMLQFARVENVNIYYYPIEADRAANNDNYQQILTILNNYLPIDTVTQDPSDSFFTPYLKRVVLPHLFFLNDGHVMAQKLFYENNLLANNEALKIRALLQEMLRTIQN